MESIYKQPNSWPCVPVEGHCHDNDNTLVDSKCHAKRVFLMSPRKEAVVNDGNTKRLGQNV